MMLKGMAMLAADTARSKAYLQAMERSSLMPERCVVYSQDIEATRRSADGHIRADHDVEFFDLDEPILSTIDRMAVPCTFVEERDVNSRAMIDVISAMTCDLIIYSGYGANVLKPELFRLGKKYIHVHAGKLPQYRGSTTAYFGYLQTGHIDATAIFLNERIDEGEIIASMSFDIPREPVDIDLLFEPYVRSQVLIDVLRMYADLGYLPSSEQEQEGAQTYFVIHPVLKHIAMLKAGHR